MMVKRQHSLALSALAALMTTAAPALAQEMSMWSRASAAPVNERVIERWNSERPDAPISLTVIPNNEVVTKVATAATMGDAPDLLSIDLIFAPPFMRAGFFEDVTDFVTALPNWEQTVEAHRTLSTYEGRNFGIPFAPENSVLFYNKELFRQAGLDPEDPPRTPRKSSRPPVRSARSATTPTAIISLAPAAAATSLPPRRRCGRPKARRCYPASVATRRWSGTRSRRSSPTTGRCGREGLIPESSQVDGGTSFISAFAAGNIGMVGLGNFAIGQYRTTAPDLDFGVTMLPGGTEGETGSFAGGDILAIPASATNKETAREFMAWALSDVIQQEVFADNGYMPARLDIAETAFAGDERLMLTVEAMRLAKTPYTNAFFALSNDPNGPWLATIQAAVFDGDIEGGIATGKERMNQIICD